MKGENKSMHYGASYLLFRRAEVLRKFPTHEEEIVWGYLKENAIGVKFRRQHLLLFYIADFYCHQLKLVIEIDGLVHNKADVKINDAIRQAEIEKLGITVIRFTNSQVKNNLEIILEEINKTIEELKNSRVQSPPLGAKGLKAIIFSAGLGTRFKPWTDSHPKALALVNGKPLLQRNIEYLQQYGIKDVIVNIHHFPQQIIDAIKKNKGWGSNVIISDESNEVLETGGGLIKARHLLENGKPFFSLNVDILTNLDLHKMMAFHQQHKPLITFGVTNRKSSRVLLLDNDNRLCGWKNLQTGEEKGPILTLAKEEGTRPMIKEMAYSCVVIYEPEIFNLIRQKGKFSIMDTYLDLAAEHVILGYDHSGDKLVDVGKPESVAVAEKLFP
jgi:very-short-patch-repair endonuclease/CTP:phosphocholine cytidylyltransferase-like protein